MNTKFKKIACSLVTAITTFSVSLNAFAWSSDTFKGTKINIQPGTTKNIGTGHKSMILTFSTTEFTKGISNTNRTAENNREYTAEAARLTDELDYMSASANKFENNTHYSPYHAKTEYSMNSVIAHAGFIYDLAKTCLSGKNLDTNLNSYSQSKTYNSFGQYIGTIDVTTQKRIVSNLSDLMGNFKINSAYDQGYVILGVYLHLLQDIYCHRAAFTQDMVDNIPNFSNFTGYTKASLKAAIGSGIPFIRIKYLLDKNGSYTYSDSYGNNYSGLTYNQVYEDNPFYCYYRFALANSSSVWQIRNIMNNENFYFNKSGATFLDVSN